MKSLLTLTLFILISTVPMNAGWFGNDEEKQRRIQTEQQLQQEREATGRWQLIAGGLAIACVLVLVVGAAIGSQARKEVGNGPR